MIGKQVIVRTTNAGVHYGTLKYHDVGWVVLCNASRIWRWRGANTLHELSLRGPNREQYTRISEPVADIALLDAIEIIPVFADASAFAPVWCT